MSKKFKHHSLIDKVYKRPNLYIAFERVKANKGAAGIDRVTLEEFEQNLAQNIEEIHRLLYEDKYKPQPVRRVYIPKLNGEERPLGIPTVRDRIVQQAILNRIGKIFEPKFKNCSYGFRPGHSPLQAVAKVEEYLKQGYSWVVEVDIKNFFDSVNHEKLIKLIKEEIVDRRVLRLIKAYLESGVMEEMKVKYQVTGTPQGGVISPILANIYLHPYDQKMTEEDYKVIRYADDIVILARTKEEAEKALERTKQILEKELKLSINPAKTRIRHKSKTFEFLGYIFGCKYADYKIPRPEAVKKYKDKVRRITRRQQPKSIVQIIEGLKPVIRGWAKYFMEGNCKRIFWQLDCWTRDRVRAYKLKKWSKLSHLKISGESLEKMGLITLYSFLTQRQPKQLALFPAKGQR